MTRGFGRFLRRNTIALLEAAARWALLAELDAA
jgi:hypothetical protein